MPGSVSGMIWLVLVRQLVSTLAEWKVILVMHVVHGDRAGVLDVEHERDAGSS